MTRLDARPGIAVALLGLAALAGTATFSGAESGQNASGAGKACKISASEEGGMLALTARFTAPVAVSGAYEFRIAGDGAAGSTRITQADAFRAAAGQTVPLGNVTLSTGKVYEAVLTVRSGGQTWRCAETFDF